MTGRAIQQSIQHMHKTVSSALRLLAGYQEERPACKIEPDNMLYDIT